MSTTAVTMNRGDKESEGVKVTIEEMTCPRPNCGHKWFPRSPIVKGCPKCKGPLDRPPRYKTINNTVKVKTPVKSSKRSK